MELAVPCAQPGRHEPIFHRGQAGAAVDRAFSCELQRCPALVPLARRALEQHTVSLVRQSWLLHS